MANTVDVKKSLPGIQFRVEDATKGAKTAAGTQHGIIKLRCEFTEPALWDAAIQKLDGFKIFSDIAGEIVDAIGEELDKTMETLSQAQARCAALELSNAEKDKENLRLRRLLLTVEVDIDGEGWNGHL